MKYIAPRTLYFIDVWLPKTHVLSSWVMLELAKSVFKNTKLNRLRGLNIKAVELEEDKVHYAFTVLGLPWRVEGVGVQYELFWKTVSVDVKIRTMQVGAGAVVWNMEKEKRRTVKFDEVVEYYTNKFRTGKINIRPVLWKGVKKGVFNIIEIGGEYYVQLRKDYKKIIERGLQPTSS